VTRDKNDGNFPVRLQDPLLEIEPAKTWQRHIQYQAARNIFFSVSQKLLSRSKSLDLPPNRSKKTFQTLPNREIIVYDKDDCFGF
jgi:hypothetical protein